MRIQAMADSKSKLLVITDAGFDLDDELAIAIMHLLQSRGLVEVLGFVTNLKPAGMRARVVRGLSNVMGGSSIPVGSGLGMNDKGRPAPEDNGDCPYLASLSAIGIGDEIVSEILVSAEPNSITLVLQSGMADAYALAMNYGHLLRSKVKDVVIMGGVETEADGSVVTSQGLVWSFLP